ncbi:hypothetical protein N825_00870 [Skermanella stibiiresistens SB22]|uniref:Uncharacterized protein n=1 Tax=Skermanella stibiiresistens SB22 TaxID=1385369 RepID=W9H967_9PROT|nr:hypothetical protein N825_00870 [Skermanella stibiiresistens SB22]
MPCLVLRLFGIHRHAADGVLHRRLVHVTGLVRSMVMSMVMMFMASMQVGHCRSLSDA